MKIKHINIHFEREGGDYLTRKQVEGAWLKLGIGPLKLLLFNLMLIA